MVRVCSYAAQSADIGQALQMLDTAADIADEAARMIFVFYNANFEARLIHAYLRRRFPFATIIGGSTYKSLIVNGEIVEGNAIGILILDDAEGDYGVALGPLGHAPAQTAQHLLHTALERANCAGQIPELIWIYQAPGCEEEVIAGLRNVIGERCPILGGSAADDDIDGHWSQMGPDGVQQNGLAIAVLFPSGGIGFALQSGCEPAGPHGVVTLTQGNQIVTIDDLPAAEVYNRWEKNRFDRWMEHGGVIAAATVLSPLGIRIGSIDQVPHYQLLHPHTITPTGALRFFTSVPEGTTIYAMRGSETRVIQRTRRIALQARTDLPHGSGMLAGGLVTACCGFRMAMEKHIHVMASEINSCFSSAPFLGSFTFGEQGYLLDRNMHGNLMISAIAFGR